MSKTQTRESRLSRVEFTNYWIRGYSRFRKHETSLRDWGTCIRIYRSLVNP